MRFVQIITLFALILCPVQKYPEIPPDYTEILVYLSPDFVIWLDCNLNRNALGRRLIHFKYTFKQAYDFLNFFFKGDADRK